MQKTFLALAVVLTAYSVYASSRTSGYCTTSCKDCQPLERFNCWSCCMYGYPHQCFYGI